ncbi:restriction endonuclease subunit S [Wohlfahrtiimonas sp. G9077]|uniref:restriction endonuclease subunit S n=1 Tax=Wohlfahrtiimonas sp. G9077 TaxID=1980118 RepID=UPI000B98879D|nr:restriction endonuclease subunit S [Wohlfahrtiimonas sp. G9077]OYQ75125.1 hypothetical protein B9T20_00040 [Wohlfahrtiimonas sp. G9077]
MKKTLKEIANLSLGYPFRGKVEEVNPDSDNAIPVIQLRNCSIEHGIEYTQCTFVNVPSKMSHHLQDQDILFAARSSQNYAVLFEKDQAQKHDYIASLNFFIIRITDESILPDFLVWQLNQVICQQYFEKNSEGTAAKNIRRPIIEALPIAIPDITTQQTIVELARAQSKQHLLFSKLMHNNERMMTAIAQKINH